MMDPYQVGLISATAATFIALLFAHAAWLKVADFEAFQGRVVDYRVVPASSVSWVSKVIATAEIAIAVTLIVPGAQIVGALLGILLLLVYAASMSVNLSSGRDYIQCGCGGPPQSLSWSLVLRNVSLVAVAALILLPSAQDPSWGDRIVTLCSGIAAWSMFTVIETVMSNRSHARMMVSGRHQ